MNRSTEFPDDGETRRVVFESGEMVGADAIARFADVDRPNRAYQVVVFADNCPDGLKPGDLAVIRWRPAKRTHRHAWPAAWELVEVTADVLVEEPEPQMCE